LAFISPRFRFGFVIMLNQCTSKLKKDVSPSAYFVLEKYCSTNIYINKEKLEK